MSGIFGILNRNGTPVNSAELSSMHETFAQWFDEDRGQWVDRNIGLGHTMQWNTPESSLEKLPRCEGEPGSRLVITSHTRLDNRKELIDKLGIRRPIGSVPDSELILASYKKWGEECLRHLLGDFAFAIWDERSSRLFCARDHMGIQPLFYRTVNNQFIFANNIEPLVQGSFPSPRLKEETVAKFLRDGENYSASDTFFENVFQLPPGSFLIADVSRVMVKQYWSLERTQPFKLSGIDDYCEMLLELLTEAVSSRLRSQYPVGAHLSGGLDSSGIVACAGSTGGLDAVNLSTFNWMHAPQSNKEFAATEWSMGREIAETYQLPHLYTEFTSDDALSLLYSHDLAMGDTVDVWAEKPLASKAAGMGIRTMLSGWGGDQLISNYGNDVYAERVLRGGVFASLWELLKACKSANKWMYSYPAYVNMSILQPLARAYGRPFGTKYRRLSTDYLDYASPELRMTANKSDQLLAYNGIYLRNQQLCAFQQAHLFNRVNSWAVSGRMLGLNYSYPLLDKRLVEMAVSVPADVFRKNGVPRYLFRRAMKNFEPVGFWWRDQKYEPYRVESTLRVYADAAKAWARERPTAGAASPLIDQQRLIKDINELDLLELNDKRDFIHRTMVIKRSILVLGLESYI